MSVFIDRNRELDLLHKRYNSRKAEFLILYGRRRVGKSELIENFLSKSGIFGLRLLAREESKKYQLSRFTGKIAEFFSDPVLENVTFTDWDGFFEYLTKVSSKKRITIALDEIPYLIKEDKSLPSILQDFWDNKLSKTKIFLIVCGSSIRMMEAIQEYGSPLFGRRTGQVLLKQFRFIDVFHYIKNIQSAVEHYCVFGGTPAYIMEIDVKKNVIDNINETIFRSDSYLFRDIEFVLRQELVEPRYYFSILLSISKGNHKIGLICNETGLSKSIVNKYLSVLMDLQLVHREVPVTEDFRSRKGLYYLDDRLFDFWFKFVYPNIELIENEKTAQLLDYLRGSQLSEYIGRHFERIIIEIIPELFGNKYPKVGRWWEKGEEIDVVALNENSHQILFCECKWSSNIDPKKLVKKLLEKSKSVKWHNTDRKVSLVVFAKSFKKRITEHEETSVYCYDLKDLQKVLTNR